MAVANFILFLFLLRGINSASWTVAKPASRGAKWKNLPNFFLFFPIFSFFFLIFSLFFPIFGKFFTVKGVLFPLDPPVAMLLILEDEKPQNLPNMVDFLYFCIFWQRGKIVREGKYPMPPSCAITVDNSLHISEILWLLTYISFGTMADWPISEPIPAENPSYLPLTRPINEQIHQTLYS